MRFMEMPWLRVGLPVEPVAKRWRLARMVLLDHQSKPTFDHLGHRRISESR